MQNMTKRLLCLVMTVILVLSMIPAVFATEAAADAVAVNTTTGVQYASLADALLEAADGQTIQLQQDAEDTITTVFENVTLDLNGNTLTTDYMTCFGNLVDTGADNAGLLCVSAERFMLQETNSQLPVKTAEGYRFAELSGFNTALVNETKYVFQPLFEAASHEALAQGKAVTGVSVQVYVSWQQGEGTRYQTFSFNDSHLQGFLASYKAASNKYSKQFALSLLGAENFEGLQFAARIVSDTGVVFGAKADSILPEGSVEVDEENKLVGDTTLESAHGTAYVAAGTKLNEGVTTLTLTTTPAEGSNGLEISEDQQLSTLDVHVAGIAADNTVPVIVTLHDLAPEFLNQGNLALYHVENGENVPMTRVMALADVDAHNEYYYDVATGTVTMALASFSNIMTVSDLDMVWQGGYDFTWYPPREENDTTSRSFQLYNADQLAAFGCLVGGMQPQFNDQDMVTGFTYNTDYRDGFEGDVVTLMADVNLGGYENMKAENPNAHVFYPIGYHYDVDENGMPSSNVSAFQGTFDGAGHVVKDLCQRTWDMLGDDPYYNLPTEKYYNDAMGLFGYVYGGTVKNLTMDGFESDGEFTPTGCVAAYAVNSTFENIALTNCNPRVYNTGNGGIVGIAGNSTDTDSYQMTFRNITVDKTNKISALWGSWDVACGGLVGMFRGNGKVHFENCHVAAQIDAYNDVCANYQYFWYRYAGMMIGSIRKNVTDANGHVVPDLTGITAKNCTVHYGDWNDYYYCEIVANSLASYTHDHQFSRLVNVDSIDVAAMEYTIGSKTHKIPTSGWQHYVIETRPSDPSDETAVCYHFKDGKVWQHEDAGFDKVDVNGDGELNDYMEDWQHIYLPFDQLFTGYGWGVDSIAVTEVEGNEDLDIKILGRNEGSSVDKFQSINQSTSFLSGELVGLNKLFAAVQLPEGVQIDQDNVQVFVSPADEYSTGGAVYTANRKDWTMGTLTFTGAGNVNITITDYNYCNPITIENVYIMPQAYLDLTYHKDGNQETLALYLSARSALELRDFSVAVSGGTFQAAAGMENTLTVADGKISANAIHVGTDAILLGTFEAADKASVRLTDTQGYTIALGGNTLCDIDVHHPAYFSDGAHEAHRVTGETDETFQVAGWQPWTRTDALPEESGNYYLVADVYLPDQANLNGGEVHLCLNGKTITALAQREYNDGLRDRIYSIGSQSEKVELHIHDCSATTVDDVYHAGQLTGADAGVIMIPNFVDPVKYHLDTTFYFYDGIMTGNNFYVPKDSGCAAVLVQDTGKFHMYGGQISGNSNTVEGACGAAVFVGSKSFMHMHGGVICNNTADRGPAFWLHQGKLLMENGTITGNRTGAFSGGAMYATNSNVTIRNSSFTDNHANATAGRGGAIYSVDSVLTVENSTFSGNTAFYAGAICMELNEKTTATMDLTVTGSVFEGNSGYNQAGAIFVNSGDRGGKVSISGCTFNKNKTDGNTVTTTETDATTGATVVRVRTERGFGGAMRLYGKGLVATVSDTQVTKNEANVGGGIYVDHYADATFTNVTFDGNLTHGAGATALAIYDNTKCTVDSCSFKNNVGDSKYCTDNGVLVGQKAAVYLANSLSKLIVKGNTIMENNRDQADRLTDIYLQNNDGYPGQIPEGKTPHAILTLGTLTETAKFNITSGSRDVTQVTNIIDYTSEAPDLTVWNEGNVTWTNAVYYPIASDGTKLYMRLHTHAADYVGSDAFWQPWTSATTLPNYDDVQGLRYTIDSEEEGTLKPLLDASGNHVEGKNGHYFLTTDVELDGTRWYSSGTIYLCLNGHDITVNAVNANVRDRIYRINQSAQLVICDCNGHGLDESDPEYEEKVGKLSGATDAAILIPDKDDDENAQPNTTQLTIYDGVFTGNYNDYCAGGAIVAQNGATLNIYGGLFKDNSAIMPADGSALAPHGGAIYGGGATVNITGGLFCNNTSKAMGGAIYLGNCTGKITNVTITGNKAVQGGAVTASGGSLTMSDCKITNNSATQYGAIHLLGGCQATLERLEITGNSSANEVGAINVEGGADVILKDSTVTGNTSGKYGAVFVFSGNSKMTIEGETVINNNLLKGSTQERNLYIRTKLIKDSSGNAQATPDDAAKIVYAEPRFLVDLKNLHADAKIGIYVAFDDPTCYEGFTPDANIKVHMYRITVRGDKDYSANIETEHTVGNTVVTSEVTNHAWIKWQLQYRNPNYVSATTTTE